MKRMLIVLGVVLSMFVGGIAFADSLSIGETLQKLPGMKQGIGYSFKDSDIDYLTTLEVFSFKGFSLEAGYSTKDVALGVISFNLLKLKDLGVTLPILDLIEIRPGVYAGYSRINLNQPDTSKFDFGASLTLITVKF